MSKYIVLDSGVYIEESYKFDTELIFEGGNAPYTTNVWHTVENEEDYNRYCEILNDNEVEYLATDSTEELK